MGSVCINKTEFYAYAFILALLVVYLLYLLNTSPKESLTNIDLTSHLSIEDLRVKVKVLSDSLHQSKLNEQQCNIRLLQLQQEADEMPDRLVSKMYNPLQSPTRMYTNTNQRSRNQMIGYVHNGDQRYPLFGRHKYPGRTEKWEYYIVDESRNRLKIPFRSINDNELMTDDTVDIPTVGNFEVFIYEYDQFRYDPNIL